MKLLRAKDKSRADWPEGKVGFRAAVLLGLALCLAGCGKRSSEGPPEKAPDAARMVLEGLTDNRPVVLWDALPPSYQADIRELIVAFCDHIDSNLYDRSFRILAKGVEVLKKQKDFIFNSPLTLDSVLIDSGIGMNWDLSVGLLDRLVRSEISTCASLRQMDPGDFLNGTASRLMRDMEELASISQRSPERNPWVRAREALSRSQVRFVPGENGQGYLTLATPDSESGREIAMTQIEGCWIPTEMAQSWEERISRAKSALAQLDTPEAQKLQPMVTMGLNTMEGTLDAMLAAKSQQEFDTLLRTWMNMGDLFKRLAPTAQATAPVAETTTTP